MVAPSGTGNVSTACFSRDKTEKAKLYVTAYAALYGTDVASGTAYKGHATAYNVGSPKAGSLEKLMQTYMDDATVKTKAEAYAKAETMVAVAYLAHAGVVAKQTLLNTSATNASGGGYKQTSDTDENNHTSKTQALTAATKTVTDIQAEISTLQASVSQQQALIDGSITYKAAGNTGEIPEMANVLALAEADLKEQKQATAKALNTYVTGCDPAVNDTAEGANPCVLATLWSELTGYNSAFSSSQYTQPTDLAKVTNSLTEARKAKAGATGLDQKVTDAKAEVAKKLAARQAISGADAAAQAAFLKTLTDLRKTANDKLALLVTARGDLAKANQAIAAKQGEVDVADAALTKALMDCKVEQYDAYSKALKARVA
jgi:hypothetical protein